MFSKKNKEKSGSHVINKEVEIPGWDSAPYRELAREWANRAAGLCEGWSTCLMNGDLDGLLSCLQKVPSEKGKEILVLGRRGWILLAAYRKMHEKVLQLEKTNKQLEQELVESRNSSTMLACQNKLLQDKFETYQNVAVKTAIRVAQYKHKNAGEK